MTAFTLNPNPHPPTDACAHCHCYYHDVDEAGETYIECYECGHAYPSKRALRRAHRDMPMHLWWRALLTPASRITYCPLCAHSW